MQITEELVKGFSRENGFIRDINDYSDNTRDSQDHPDEKESEIYASIDFVRISGEERGNPGKSGDGPWEGAEEF